MRYRKQSLGRMAVFLLPSLKLKSRVRGLGQLEQWVHNFLLAHYGGYTVTSGNIFGYWRASGREFYGEHRLYTVAFLGKQRIPSLERFLARLARSMGEQCIYLETGEDAWLVFAANGIPRQIKLSVATLKRLDSRRRARRARNRRRT